MTISLSLFNTRVTDVELKNLASLKNLDTLDLTKIEVTDAEVRELQKALPNCKITR